MPGHAIGAIATSTGSSASCATRDGRADRLPIGAVYEATMRCNLHCEFCYVIDFLNIEGEWRQEMTVERLRQAFPDQPGFQVSLTGGEIFMRKDIMSVLDLFQEKGYSCGYLTTNGTIINEERAEALADLAAAGFLKHISVSVDGPGELHDRARGLKGTFERTCAGLRRLQEAARRKHAPLRVSINTTVAQESLEALDAMVDVAGELGVDAIGLNHLMFSTPEEVEETVRMIGADDASVIATFITPDPGLDIARVKHQVAALAEKCKQRNVLFDYRPKVHPQLMDNYYTPGAKLEGRCLYPVPARSRGLLRQGLLLPVHPRRSGRSRDVVARRNLERTDLRRACGDGFSITASFRSAGAAAKSSCRRSRWRNPSPTASLRDGRSP